MSATTENTVSKIDIVKWVIVAIAVAAAVFGNTHFSELHLALRVTAVIAVLALAAGIALTTDKGRQAIEFAKESRIEIRKVVWPTRQETMHTTLYVFVMTVILSLILWVIDFALLRLVALITNQGA